MDKDKIIALLNQDLEGEQAAIIQYLVHAYAMAKVRWPVKSRPSPGKKCAILTGWLRR